MAESSVLVPLGPRVWVPGYIKSDGTQVDGYWRAQVTARPKSPVVRGRVFAGRTFRGAATFKRRSA